MESFIANKQRIITDASISSINLTINSTNDATYQSFLDTRTMEKHAMNRQIHNHAPHWRRMLDTPKSIIPPITLLQIW
jgi:hypothetical protein